MDGFVTRKRRQDILDLVHTDNKEVARREGYTTHARVYVDDDSTEVKLATLASLHPNFSQDALLEALLRADGSVERASSNIQPESTSPRPRKTPKVIGFQSTLFGPGPSDSQRTLTRRGKTLYLYSPADVERHTPCSIIHNFLPPDHANALLVELLKEKATFTRETFKLFDRVVESLHTSAFYVNNARDAESQRTEYVYNGSSIADVRQTTPHMRSAAVFVQSAVNDEIDRRIKTFYPDGKKLKYQSPKPWIPNASFVNAYTGGGESVGYHADTLSYLGPHAVIGSLSLGVAREFRVRRIVPRAPSETAEEKDMAADQQGQVSIHLPHNSLLVMHAEMQEEYKHAIVPAAAIDPHPIAGNTRINITYRYYRESFHPRHTPKCKCGIATVLRCVQKRHSSKGQYMWMCHASYTPGRSGCNYFAWAEFDDDGEPPWACEASKGSKAACNEA